MHEFFLSLLFEMGTENYVIDITDSVDRPSNLSGCPVNDGGCSRKERLEREEERLKRL